jgi:hypothetical protein
MKNFISKICLESYVDQKKKGIKPIKTIWLERLHLLTLESNITIYNYFNSYRPWISTNNDIVSVILKIEI